MVATEKSKKSNKKDEVELPKLEEREDSAASSSGMLNTYKEFDLINDLNNEFFAMAQKTIQTLGEENKWDLASEVKQYVTVLHDLHEKYVLEVNEKNELKPKLVEADNKLNYALKITGESQDVMNALKLSLENAWREGDASKTREQGFQDQLREMIVKCEKFTKKDQISEQDDAAEFGHLAKHKHIILKERDRLNSEVIELQKRVQMQRVYIESLEKVWQNSEEVNYKTNRKVETLETEKINLEKRLRLGKEINEELKEANRTMTMKNEVLSKQVSEQNVVLGDRQKEIDKLRVNIERTKNEYSALMKSGLKYKNDLNLAIQDKKTLQELYKNLKDNHKSKIDEGVQLTKSLKKVRADFDNLSSKIFKMDKLQHTLKEENVKYKNTTNNLEKSLLENAIKFENLRRLKDITTHERDNLRSDSVKLNNQISELKHAATLKNNLIDNLNLEIQKNITKIDEVKKQLGRVERERDEQIQEVQSLQDKIVDFQEQFQIKVTQIVELNSQLDLKQTAYIKIQKLLETTNSERLMLQRSLQSCCEERSNLKLFLSKNTHQIAQLTEEITANQNCISSLNLQIEHLRSEKQEVETELRTTKDVLKNTRQEMKELKNKNEALQKTIVEDELRFLKLSIQLDDVRKEKNLIGLQMVRRNDEIILVKEKLSIFQTALDRGQIQYNQRIEDIRLLKLEISNLQTQRDVLTRGIESTADMREEVVRLQRSLNQEKVRNRVLTEDLQTPANVHRWRILGGTDPDRCALIEKVQVLQKKIMKLNIESMERENSLQESHKLYLTLKSYVSKLPTPKLKEDLVSSQRWLRNKDKQLKAVIAELTTKEMDVQARECVISELQTSLVLAKKDLLAEKKASSKLKFKSAILESYEADNLTTRSV